MTDGMESLDLQATKSLGQAEDVKNREADWAVEQSEGRKFDFGKSRGFGRF
jgi:hypothetical protein